MMQAAALTRALENMARRLERLRQAGKIERGELICEAHGLRVLLERGWQGHRIRVHRVFGWAQLSEAIGQPALEHMIGLAIDELLEDLQSGGPHAAAEQALRLDEEGSE